MEFHFELMCLKCSRAFCTAVSTDLKLYFFENAKARNAEIDQRPNQQQLPENEFTPREEHAAAAEPNNKKVTESVTWLRSRSPSSGT